MSHRQGKIQNGQGNVREKWGNFVRAHGWTPCVSLNLRKMDSIHHTELLLAPGTYNPWFMGSCWHFMHTYTIATFGPYPEASEAPLVESRLKLMMTSSNGIIFHVTGPLWGESIGHWWIPLTKASNAELWCFLWCVPEQIMMLVIWEAMALIMMSL